MALALLNLESDQQIQLDIDNPLVIGRKNVKQCQDKRVSRYHGKVVCKPDGKISLIALHSNPCFYTQNGVPPVLKLNKDEEKILSEGDCFGLLPDSYWFRIIDKAKCHGKKSLDSKKLLVNNEESPGATLEVIDETKSSNETNMELGDLKEAEERCKTPCSESELTSKINLECITKSESICNGKKTLAGYGTPEFEKTRRLPLSMYEIDEPLKPEENPCQQLSFETKSKQNKKEIKLESEAAPSINLPSEMDAKAKEDIKEDNSLSLPPNERIGSTSPNESDFAQDQKSPLKNLMLEDGDERQSYESDVDVENEEFDKSRRPTCLYEDNCYRRNPQHRMEFCHPGDSDYVPYEERPICSYGGSCYRMNKTHRIEFRHPPDYMNRRNQSQSPVNDSPSPVSSPLPDKRRRKRVEREEVDLPEEGENSPEDPFAGNGSSDEFVPTDSDADGDTEALDDD